MGRIVGVSGTVVDAILPDGKSENAINPWCFMHMEQASDVEQAGRGTYLIKCDGRATIA